MVTVGGRRRSLMELAAERLEGLIDPDNRLICTSERYREAIRTALPTFSDAQILGEPVGRDTVNAVGFAAGVIEKVEPGASFCMLTADHLIEPVDVFRKRIELGFELVEQDARRLVTFSIAPTYAATGYGYVERGREINGTNGFAFSVERFVEKPSAEKAQAYIESGVFGWNSGMFVWRASTFLDCLRRYKPQSHEGIMQIACAWGTADQQKVLGEVYPTLPKISDDYAVMEPATREQARAARSGKSQDGVEVCTVNMDLTWLDVGSWPSFAQTLTGKGEDNRTSGSAIIQDSTGTLVVNADDRHTVAALGCEDLIIVHTEDATLVMPRDKAEELKRFHGELPDRLT